jgi:hypothetical protein
VLTDAPVVEDRQLLAVVGVAPIGDAARVLTVGEAGVDVAAVAEWFHLRRSATAKHHRRPRLQRLAEPVEQTVHVRQQIRPVIGDLDLARERSLNAPKLCQPISRITLGEGERELLQRRSRLRQERVVWCGDTRLGNGESQPPKLVYSVRIFCAQRGVSSVPTPGRERPDDARAQALGGGPLALAALRLQPIGECRALLA